jgi:hypothetical protein
MLFRLILFLIFFISLGALPQALFGWDDQTTHPALTDEAVEFYNSYFGDKLTSKQKSWLIQGSIAEDTPPRWINHFYDPIYNQGWTGEHGPDFMSEGFLREFSDVFVSFEDPVSAKNWAQNQELQTKYRLYKANKTWQKALYEYVEKGNKKEAFFALGHVLHLLQDMAVPEHTRNDSHVPTDGSPLESFATRFTRKSFHIADDLLSQNYEPRMLESLGAYFKYLANYSNNYFFSKDTISDAKYEKPSIVEESDEIAYGHDEKFEKFPLSIVDIKREKRGDYFKRIKVYSLGSQEIYHPILRAYSDRLLREALLASAGLIDLFFREAGRAEQNPDLLEIPPEEKSALVSLFKGEMSLTGEVFRLKRLFSSMARWFVGLFQKSSEPLAVPSAGGPALLVSDQRPRSPAKIPESSPAPRLQPRSLPEENLPVPEIPSAPKPPATPLLKSEVERPTPMEREKTAVEPRVFEVQPQIARAPRTINVVALPYPGFGGGGSAAFPKESKPASSAPEAPTDTIPPTILSLEIPDCADSFVANACIVATTTVSLMWQSPDEDVEFYEVVVNGALAATTTATSTILIYRMKRPIRSVLGLKMWPATIPPLLLTKWKFLLCLSLSTKSPGWGLRRPPATSG